MAGRAAPGAHIANLQRVSSVPIPDQPAAGSARGVPRRVQQQRTSEARFRRIRTVSANIASALFTHFKREEDHAMKSGKLDEELKRMSDIVQEIRPNALVLLNEFFAATNEREGSEIARQIVAALLEKQIKVFFVTHLYDFAHSLETRNLPEAIFLRVERQSDGRRTFKLGEGGPLETSYGEDLYNRIFMLASGRVTHEASSKCAAYHV